MGHPVLAVDLGLHAHVRWGEASCQAGQSTSIAIAMCRPSVGSLPEVLLRGLSGKVAAILFPMCLKFCSLYPLSVAHGKALELSGPGVLLLHRNNRRLYHSQSEDSSFLLHP